MRGNSAERRLERTERERDLYLRLLQLGSQTEIQPFLEEALRLVVEITGARQGYLELRDAEVEENGPHWFMARGFSEQEVSDVRLQLSRGIIAEAMATGQIILVNSGRPTSLRESSADLPRLRRCFGR